MPSPAARRAVPWLRRWLTMPAMSDATEAGIACSGFLPSRSKRQTRSPAPVRTSSTACGVADLPLLAKVAYATACSTTVTSSEPIGIDGVSGSGALRPKRRATSVILTRPALAGLGGLPPSAIDQLTGTTVVQLEIGFGIVNVP